MKATGIVRRIDDLGRVVIPKEIRRTMRIREGDPLEIFTDREGEVIFKKYSPIGELNAFASQYAETLHRTGELNVVITDRDSVIASAGVPKKEFSERRVSGELDRLMEERTLYAWKTGEPKKTVTDGESTYYASCMMPILSEGDVIGAVISLSPADTDRPAQPTDLKLIQTAAVFLGRQLEG